MNGSRCRDPAPAGPESTRPESSGMVSRAALSLERWAGVGLYGDP